ncbi:MAG TPA: serine protease, partial [Gemmatimonadales bacterium]|nr:serine protease [Gemmatimonadales bacterium]
QGLDAHAPLLSAALFDATPIVTANSRAITMVFAQSTGGGRTRSTGFVLRVSADTGWVVTNRAALLDSTGAPAERIAVGFNGSNQGWRARVIAEQPATGLALLRVLAWGHVFPVAEVRDSVAVTGQPVIVFGFPEGPEQGGPTWQRDGLRASVITGTLTAASEKRLEIEGYGVTGWVGSPVFNAAGQLIGVIATGEGGSAPLSAIPTSAIRGWMRQ